MTKEREPCKLYIWGRSSVALVKMSDQTSEIFTKADPEDQADRLALWITDILPNRVAEKFIQSIGGDMNAMFDLAQRAHQRTAVPYRPRKRVLTAEQERFVVQSSRPAVDLAQEFNVSAGTIWRLRREAKKETK